ncbi:MAG: tRNA (adenosine(37)-N6)-dimethylallyltransferase MiaA [Clostridia bacterium]|nr:tRNA (adenosine(37)-N6)-dimethylallyltransferase MiaA [Clostridia bacterium]
MIRTVFIVGPTASGKTEYSIRLAEDLDGQIVSADSMQLYKYLNIGSAKPTKEEMERVPHFMVDCFDPKDAFSVYDYMIHAKYYIEQIYYQAKMPIVCGGTGLYVNSLVYEMDFTAPEGNNDYRERIRMEEDSDPIKLHERLRRLDPKAAEEIHPNNVKRVLRAIERLEKGEGTLARFADAVKPSYTIEPVMIGLNMDREVLYDRINKRVDKLYDMGLEEEVRGLMDMGFTSKDVAMKGIGYKEIIDCITEGKSAEDAKEIIKANTRHYARRQLIWFRRYPQINWVNLSGDGFDEEAYEKIMTIACS